MGVPDSLERAIKERLSARWSDKVHWLCDLVNDDKHTPAVRAKVARTLTVLWLSLLDLELEGLEWLEDDE